MSASSSAAVRAVADLAADLDAQWAGLPYFAGTCPVCGADTLFVSTGPTELARECLMCPECVTTSRYRSLALGVLRAVEEICGVRAPSLAALPEFDSSRRLRVYDTQTPFAYERAAYPLPALLAAVPWIHVETSDFAPSQPAGALLPSGGTNQNLEALTFPDDHFDILLTSDVMEHVRLIDRAHAEIARVLRPGGVYLFTVPHTRAAERLVRVRVHDEADASKDEFVLEPEYHGDVNGPDMASLSYRVFGTEIDGELASFGLSTEYSWTLDPGTGVMHTELFYCRRE